MPPFKPLRTEKFSQEVANQIKESIFDGTYVSGDKLPSEGDMSQLFAVSKVTVRQAIRVLENSGIVYTKQGVDGGIFVAEADTMSVSSYLSDMLKLKRVKMSDLTMARIIFEPDIVYRVAKVWEGDDLEVLEKNVQEAQIALDKNEFRRSRLLNLEFHRLVCNISKNPVVIFALNSVIDVLEENVLKTELDRDFIRDEIIAHETIIEKIRSREREQAHDEMREHIKVVHQKLEEIYSSGDRQIGE
ncbi:MAG: FCD domain-containing protein [Desulfobacterales bacterium]|nr:FCD domain-containing protein [Desulfobacterales bacterium]